MSQLPCDRPFHSQLHEKHCIIDAKLNEVVEAAMENSCTPQWCTRRLGHPETPHIIFPTACRDDVCPTDRRRFPTRLAPPESCLSRDVSSPCNRTGFPFSHQQANQDPPRQDLYGDPPSTLSPTASSLCFHPAKGEKNHPGQAPKKHTIRY